MSMESLTSHLGLASPSYIYGPLYISSNFGCLRSIVAQSTMKDRRPNDIEEMISAAPKEEKKEKKAIEKDKQAFVKYYRRPMWIKSTDGKKAVARDYAVEEYLKMVDESIIRESSTSAFLYHEMGCHCLPELYEFGSATLIKRAGALSGEVPFESFEFIVGQTSFDLIMHLEKNGLLEYRFARHLFKEVALKIREIHNLGISHLDIKPENIMCVTETGEIKLIDFGFAASVEGSYRDGRHNINRGSYLAPERTGPCYSHPVDIYALGHTFFSLLSKLRYTDPLMGAYGDLQFSLDYQTFWNKTDKFRGAPIPEKAKDLISRMISPIPFERPTINEVLAHPFFAEGLGDTAREFKDALRKFPASPFGKK